MSTSHLQGQASVTGLQLLSSGGGTYDVPAVWWDHIGLGAPRQLALHEVVPPRGAASGGTPVRLLGTGFVDGPATVRFGTAVATSVMFASATELTATARAPMQVARASTVSDEDGARTATMLFPAGTTASMVLPDGTSSALAALNVRGWRSEAGAPPLSDSRATRGGA